MFEDRYRKYHQKIRPSDALNRETLALMQEAQDHRASEPERGFRWRPAYTVALAGAAAALLALSLTAGFWFSRGAQYIEESGDLDTVVSGGSADRENAADVPETSGGATGAEDGATSEEQPEAAPPEEEGNGESGGEEAPSGGSDSDETAPSGGDSGGSAESDPETPTDSEPEEPSAGEEPEEPADPRDPVIINDDETRTYTTIRAFLDDLKNKKTEGYGTHYYTARELIIVPSLLPDNARFRHFYLYPQTGRYAYSYLFTAEGVDYLLDIKVDASSASTLKELNRQKEAIREEKVLTKFSGNQMMVLFGTSDLVTVSLTAVGSEQELTREQVSALLEQFALERCSLTNTIVDLTY